MENGLLIGEKYVVFVIDKKYIKDKIFIIVKWLNWKVLECKWYKVFCRKILRYVIMNIKI